MADYDADLIAEGRRLERADVLAFLNRNVGAAEKQEKFGDDGAALMAARMAAITVSIAIGLHEGEASE